MHILIKVICSFVISVGQRKNSESRRESNPWPPRYRLDALTTELQETRDELGNFSSFFFFFLSTELRVSRSSVVRAPNWYLPLATQNFSLSNAREK